MFLKNMFTMAKEAKAEEQSTRKQRELDKIEKRLEERNKQNAMEYFRSKEKIELRNGANWVDARLATIKQEQEYLESIKG